MLNVPYWMVNWNKFLIISNQAWFLHLMVLFASVLVDLCNVKLCCLFLDFSVQILHSITNAPKGTEKNPNGYGRRNPNKPSEGFRNAQKSVWGYMVIWFPCCPPTKSYYPEEHLWFPSYLSTRCGVSNQPTLSATTSCYSFCTNPRQATLSSTPNKWVLVFARNLP